MKKLLLTLLAGTFAATIVGCNTVDGFGKDVEKTGSVVSGAAQNTGGTGTTAH